MASESSVSQIVGACLAESLYSRFDDAADEKQIISVADFTLDEVNSAIQTFADRFNVDGFDPGAGPLIRVAGESSATYEGIPERVVLSTSKSLTDFRNSEDAHCYVLFILAEQSDRQSFGQVYLLRDRDLIAGDRFRNGIASLLSEAWTLAFPDRDVPDSLRDRCVEVLKYLNESAFRIPLRKAAHFLRQVVARCGSISGISHKGNWSAVLASLPALDLFPDSEAAESGLTDAQILARIKRNYFAAELMKPSGTEIDSEKLSLKAQSTVFTDPADSSELGEKECRRWRKLCSRYCLVQSSESRESIPWGVFSQIFDTKTSRKLGERVRDDIEEKDSAQVEEFDELDVADGLDRGDPISARELITHVPANAELPKLIDLLKPPTRKAIEKLAHKAYTVSDLLPWLISEIHDIEYREDQKLHYTIEAEDSGAAGEGFTRVLFAFLHGATLADVAEASTDADVVFHIGKSLLSVQSVTAEDIRSTLAGRDENQDDPLWPDLLLKVRIQQDQEGIPGDLVESRVIKWVPQGALGLRLFLVVVSDTGLDVSFRLEGMSIDDWYAGVTEGTIDPAENTIKISASSASECWLGLRSEFLEQLKVKGLAADSCNRFFLEWEQSVLPKARGEFVLTGSPKDEFDDFMCVDIVDAGDSAAMLPTHPFRIRWIGAFLDEMRDKLIKALNRNLSLVKDNDSFFFAALGRLSAHQHPPCIVLPNNRVMKSSEELGLSEIYRAISVGTLTKTDWISSLDDHSIEAIAAECARFLEFHPHKRGGVDLLIVQTGRSSFVETLVLKLVKSTRLKADVTLRIHVVVPEETIETHTFFSQASAEIVGARHEGQLFPRVQLHVHPSTGSDDLPSSIKADSIDLAIVPNILVQNMQVIAKGGAADSDTQAYHPLHSRPVRQVTLADDAVNIQLDLLPNNDDQALLDWASLNVMLMRSQPLAEADSSAPAHLRLVIDVASSTKLFQYLHSRALWVVTLDGYISRRHMEQLPSRPEVITFRENIGKNGTYNLVVSSNMGKQFVVPRLAKKLAKQFDDLVRGGQCEQVAEELYFESCRLAPGIILRSLGGGWTLNELLGLVATKRLLDNGASQEGSGERVLNAWIALDEHADWFGGYSAGKRADLLRVEMFNREGRAPLLQLTVVESKFGSEQLSAQGVAQVKQSLGVIRDAFLPRSELTDDGRIWRESLLHAVENCLAVAVHENTDPGSPVVDESVRNILSNGDYELAECQACVICHVPSRATGEDKMIEDVRVVTTAKTTISRLLRREPVDLHEPDPTGIPSHEDGVVLDAGENTNVARVEVSAADASPAIENITVSPGVEPELVSSFDTLTGQEVTAKYDALMDRFAQLKVEMDPVEESQDRILEGPSVFRIRIKPSANTTIKKIRSVEEEIRTCLKLAEEQQIRIFQDRGVVWIEVPKELKKRTFITADRLWGLVGGREGLGENSFTIPLGVDMSGQTVCIDFSTSNSPHLLIAGTTGSGKSVLLETLICGVDHYYSPDEVQMFLIDPKGNELIDFEDLPHVPDDVESEPEDAANLLDKAVVEMQNRYALFKQHKAEFGKASKSIDEYNSRSDEKIPRWLIVLDEYADLVSMPDDKKEIERLLQRLCQKARAAGIHVIVATQKPLAEVIGSVVKSNLPAALAFKVGKSMDSKVILDDVGAEALAGMGDALYKDGSGRIQRLQCAMVKK